jgi:fido (protein-threonine AMPylation protein)
MPLFEPIDGETPIDDVSGLMVKGIALRSELNVVEAANILKATEKYLIGPVTERLAPFDFTWVCRLHKEMFGDVWKWAGTFRTDQTNISIPPHLIETQVYDLVACLPFWKDQPWPVQAAHLHHRAVAIHPFPNGNGRWSRMLANIWFRRNKQPFTEWPEQIGRSSQRPSG